MLVVSQFTLYGDARKGRRPSFVGSAPGEQAERLYDRFVRCLHDLDVPRGHRHLRRRHAGRAAERRPGHVDPRPRRRRRSMNGHPFLRPGDRPLVLASRSPRRAEILRAQGLDFTVQPAGIDETVLDDETPAAHVCRLALEKARAVAADHPDAMVLGSDTVVVIDGEILGKPEDEAEARAMLGRLAGREHAVYSALHWSPPTPGPSNTTPRACASANSNTARSRPTWPAASPWTRPGPTGSSSAARCWWPESTAATST